MPDEETPTVTPEVEAEFVLGAGPGDVVDFIEVAEGEFNVGVAEGEEPFHEGPHPDNLETDLEGVDAEPPPTEDEDHEAPPSEEELAALVADVNPDDVDRGFDDGDIVFG